MEPQQLSEQFEQTIAEFLDKLGVEATIKVDILSNEDKNYLDVDIRTEDGGAELIGHHGHKLDAIATVLQMMIPETEEKFSVLLDINGYRQERTKYIEDLAQRAAAQVVSTGEAMTLEPMRPWERRAFHLVLQERTDIVSESEGDEPERRIVIKPADIF